jgi:hypothetical protein
VVDREKSRQKARHLPPVDIIRFFQPMPPTFARFGLESFSEGLFDSGREKIVGFQT